MSSSFAKRLSSMSSTEVQGDSRGFLSLDLVSIEGEDSDSQDLQMLALLLPLIRR